MSAVAAPILTVEHLTMRFGGLVAIDDLSFTARRGDITALMPGKILRIDVAVGDTVTEKQTLAVMESMKMETSLLAPKSGRVAAIHCRAGQVVEMGESLIVIE